MTRLATPAAEKLYSSTRRSARWQARSAAWAMVVAVCAAGPAAATLITFDTSALAGTAARLDFSLIDGDFADNNSVTIGEFSTDGVLGGVDCTVSCSGSSPYVISDTGGLGQLLQDLTLGSFLSFDLSFSGNFDGAGGGVPDRLSLLLLDPGTNFTLVDTDLDSPPTQDALLQADLAPGARIQVAGASSPIPPGVVPEPAAASLVGLGLALLGFRSRRRSV
jgi:hypothetical protein